MTRVLDVVALLLLVTPAFGGDCGEGSAGTTVGIDCLYPEALADYTNGPTPGSTGARTVFHTESYSGTAEAKFAAASSAAYAVGGAVIVDQVYTISSTVTLQSGVLYTGGGLRRAATVHTTTTAAAVSSDHCVTVASVSGFAAGSYMVNTDPAWTGTVGTLAVATVDSGASQLCASGTIGLAIPSGAHLFKEFALATASPSYATGIVVDGMLFDGNGTSNSYTHDWTKNNTAFLRGSNTIKRSVFVDTPSENLTICGATVQDNVAANLSGSFVHVSCSVDHLSPEYLTSNYVATSNVAGNTAMGHSEGVVTFSANAANIHSSYNVFRYGSEGVFGIASPDDDPLDSTGDYFSHFSRLMSYDVGAVPGDFTFTTDTMDDVAFNPPAITLLSPQRKQGSPALRTKVATVSDIETKRGTIAVTTVGASESTGITTASPANDGNGNVMLDIAASCTAPVGTGSVTLRAEDITGQVSTASLSISVTANAAPKVGTYAAQSVSAGTTRVVTPSIVPSDNGSFASLIVTAAVGYTGTVSIDPASGNVTLTNPGPVGAYLVTITGTDNCGVVTAKSFTATVTP